MWWMTSQKRGVNALGLPGPAVGELQDGVDLDAQAASTTTTSWGYLSEAIANTLRFWIHRETQKVARLDRFRGPGTRRAPRAFVGDAPLRPAHAEPGPRQPVLAVARPPSPPLQAPRPVRRRSPRRAAGRKMLCTGAGAPGCRRHHPKSRTGCRTGRSAQGRLPACRAETGSGVWIDQYERGGWCCFSSGSQAAPASSMKSFGCGC